MKSIRLRDILKERNEYCCKDGTFVHGTLSKDGLFPKTERWNRDFLVKEENKKYRILGTLLYYVLSFRVHCVYILHLKIKDVDLI